MLNGIREKKNKVHATIVVMITFIILFTITLGLFKMTEKAIKEYDYGRICTKEFENAHKESYYFK
jgi:hypothetical protein